MKWIPVEGNEKRLKDSYYYIVWCDDDQGGGGHQRYVRLKERWYSLEYPPPLNEQFNVTHWLDIGPPPKKDDE